MKVKTKKVTQPLKLASSGNLTLTVTIGAAQIGGSIVSKSGNLIKKGEITSLDLGPVASWTGKTLNVVTNILDVNPSTNGVVATYFFTGTTPTVVTEADAVDNDGDVFSFDIDFTF